MAETPSYYIVASRQGTSLMYTFYRCQHYACFYIQSYKTKTSEHILIILAPLNSLNMWLHFIRWMYGHSAIQLCSDSMVKFWSFFHRFSLKIHVVIFRLKYILCRNYKCITIMSLSVLHL